MRRRNAEEKNENETETLSVCFHTIQAQTLHLSWNNTPNLPAIGVWQVVIFYKRDFSRQFDWRNFEYAGLQQIFPVKD